LKQEDDIVWQGLTGDNMARELAGRGIGHETHAENKAVYEV